MPTYPVINLETKEKKELSMTMKQYDQWRKDNPVGIKTGQKVVLVPLKFLVNGEAHPVDGMRFLDSSIQTTRCHTFARTEITVSKFFTCQ